MVETQETELCFLETKLEIAQHNKPSTYYERTALFYVRYLIICKYIERYPHLKKKMLLLKNTS